MSLQEQLAEIKAQALAAIEASDAEKSLNDVRVKFLGKKKGKSRVCYVG